MQEQDKTTDDNRLTASSSGAASREVLGSVFSLTGSEALNKILDHADVDRIVRDMSRVDFFWLMKKIGPDDSLPLLRSVSDDQWQYILDMELWDGDRLDFKETFQWLDRFHKSDPERLARWLYSEDGNLLAHLFFDGALEVRIKEEQDYIPPEGFFTFDNLYYIKILDKENEDVIEQMLRQLATEDYNKFQALLLGLGGMVPAEVEEEMYRMKGVRLAEDGYLPFEEAISVYSYQSPDLLKKGGADYSLSFPDEETGALVPMTPLSCALGDNIFSRAIEKISDSTYFERLRLEFAGLCNQIFSADAIVPEGIDDLVRVTKKAAGYLDIGLERLSGNDIAISEEFIRHNPLVSIFRAGFGMTLELKWMVEKKIKDSWYIKNGLDEGFWGDEWGGMLKGILMKRPLFYKGDFRPFESLSEVKIAGDILNRVVFLDKLMENISDLFGLQRDQFKDPLLTFHAILFHSWAVRKMDPEGGFAPLSVEKTREFFRLMRGNETAPPYKLMDYRDVFVGDCISLAGEIDPETKTLLHETLSGLWEEFAEEYAMVDLASLDPRFTKYIIMAA